MIRISFCRLVVLLMSWSTCWVLWFLWARVVFYYAWVILRVESWCESYVSSRCFFNLSWSSQEAEGSKAKVKGNGNGNGKKPKGNGKAPKVTLVSWVCSSSVLWCVCDVHLMCLLASYDSFSCVLWCIWMSGILPRGSPALTILLHLGTMRRKSCKRNWLRLSKAGRFLCSYRVSSSQCLMFLECYVLRVLGSFS